MKKKKHHYVPRFYLKGFESAPRRIHLYNLGSGRFVEHASLRDQCYKDKFYGPTNQTEDRLAFLEAHMASVLRTILSSNVLPTPRTDEWDLLLAFVTLQLLRTTAAANRIDLSTDKAMKQAYSRDPRIADVDLESIRIGFEDSVLVSLKNVGPFMTAIADLSAHLIFSPAGGFVTSDNPAFKYNQYCEGIDHVGVLGGLCRGFQIFMPLSPSLSVLLYDGSVYKLADRDSHLSLVSDADVDVMNGIQLVSAERNVYFSTSALAKAVRHLLPKVTRHRKIDPVRIVEYGQDNNPNASLMHEFERMPNLGLKLSFLSIRRNARRASLHDRARDYRKAFPRPDFPVPPSLEGRTVKFSRFIGER